MGATTVNKPQNLQHAKTIHRPLISFIPAEGLFQTTPVSSYTLLSSTLQPFFDTAGRNGVSVPNVSSADIDSQGIATEAENNRVLIYQAGSKNIPQDPLTGREIYGRITATTKGGDNYVLHFYYLDENGIETDYQLPSGVYDYFIPYRFSFENLPDDAIIRVKSRRSDDDPASGGQGGREIMQLIGITALNTLEDLLFLPIPGSEVWMHISGYASDSIGAPLQRSGKSLTWDSSLANFDLEQGERLIVHYETYE